MPAPIKPFPVEKEYDRNPDIRPEDIKKLREWLPTQPHLPADHLTVSEAPEPDFDFANNFSFVPNGSGSKCFAYKPTTADLDLLLTYYCCENSPEVAKQVLDLHFTLRTLFTSFFKDRIVDKKIEATFETVLLSSLSTRTVGGYKAIYCRLLNPDPRYFNFNDAIRAFMMLFDLTQYQEGTWPGFVIIIDMDETVIGHLAKLEVMSIRQVLYFLQECMLIKLKEVHFMNAPHFMDKLMMMLRPFMKKSLLDIIYIHQVGSDSLEKFVPKKALPKESGGDEKDRISLSSDSLQFLRDNPEFFRMENLKRVNETLRPGGKRATVEDLFGIQGSFKKLDID